MLTFSTVSGSIYQVDQDNKRVRRMHITDLSGESQRVSEEWRSYVEITPILMHEQVLIVWGDDVSLLKGSEAGSLPTTLTSYVIKVEEVQLH